MPSILYKLDTSLRLVTDDLSGTSWFSHQRIQHFRNLYQAFGDISENITLLDTESLKSIRNHLYSACFANLKSFSESDPATPDIYRDIPIIYFYALISDINYTLFHRWYGQLLSDDDAEGIVYYDKIPENIELCKQHGLAVSKDITISNLNLSELLHSLDVFESKMLFVGYCKELAWYLEALELRINEFILCPNTIEYHNVANMRHKHPHEDIYVCTTYCEYALAIRILAIKRDLEGSLDYLRDHDDCVRPTYPGELEAITLLHTNMLIMSQRIHGDFVQDDFSESYEQNAVRSSVGYQWLKGSKYSDVPEPLGAITQFEGEAFWKNVCTQSATEIDEHFYTMTNPAAFWIVFFQLAEVTIMSNLENDWVPSKAPDDTGAYVSDYFITNNTLKILEPEDIDTLLRRSNDVPLYLQCFSDASILFQEKLYTFGHTPTDYLRAFHSWIDIIENCFDGMFLGRIPIFKLKSSLYNPDKKADITKYVTKGHNTSAETFHLTLCQKLTNERDARISSLLTAQEHTEISTGSNIQGEEPFLADANASVWF